MTKMISRVYTDYAAASIAVNDLKAAGLADSHISILASNAEGWHKAKGGDVDPIHDKDRDGRDDRSEGAATGGGLGAIAGGAAGVAAGLGLIAIPGIGPVVAAGWLAALAAGAVGGGVAGGIVGALVESGTTKENAELYVEALRRGGVLVTARVADDDEHRYARVLSNGGIDVTTRVQAYRDTGWKGYDAAAPAYDAEQARRERTLY